MPQSVPEYADVVHVWNPVDLDTYPLSKQPVNSSRLKDAMLRFYASIPKKKSCTSSLPHNAGSMTASPAYDTLAVHAKTSFFVICQDI